MNPDTSAYIDECPTHKGHSLDFFCNNHFTLCCSECRKKGGPHEKCNAVSYGSVDLRVMQSYLPKVTKKLEKELRKANSSCAKGLSERQAELERDVAQTKEAINAYFRALEVQRAQLIEELDRMLEESDFSKLTCELRGAATSGASVLATGKRTIAEWDSQNGKEMVQRTSDILAETRALAAMTKRAESAMKSPLGISFSPAAPEPSLGKVVCSRASPASDPKEAGKKSTNDDAKHDESKGKASPSHAATGAAGEPSPPVPPPQLTGCVPQKGKSEASRKSRTSRKVKKSPTTPSPSPPPPTPGMARIHDEKPDRPKKSPATSPLGSPMAPAEESDTLGKAPSGSRPGPLSRAADTLKIFDVSDNSVFVGNLPSEVNRSNIYTIFSTAEIVRIFTLKNSSVPDDSYDGFAVPSTKWAIVTLSPGSDVKSFLAEYEGCIVNDNELWIVSIPNNSVLLSGAFAGSLAETFCEMLNGVGFAAFSESCGIVSFGSSEAAASALKCARGVSVEYKDVEVVPAPIVEDNSDDDDGDGEKEEKVNSSIVVKNVPDVISEDELRSIFEGIDVESVGVDRKDGGDGLLDWAVTFGPATDVQEVLRDLDDIVVIKFD